VISRGQRAACSSKRDSTRGVGTAVKRGNAFNFSANRRFSTLNHGQFSHLVHKESWTLRSSKQTRVVCCTSLFQPPVCPLRCVQSAITNHQLWFAKLPGMANRSLIMCSSCGHHHVVIRPGGKKKQEIAKKLQDRTRRARERPKNETHKAKLPLPLSLSIL